jgi:hypothetical protein
MHLWLIPEDIGVADAMIEARRVIGNSRREGFCESTSCEAAYFYLRDFGLNKTAIRRIATISIVAANFAL